MVCFARPRPKSSVGHSRRVKDTLRRANDTSAEPDEIHHFQLLKHLSISSLLLPLNIFNKIWISGDFSSDWRKSNYHLYSKAW